MIDGDRVTFDDAPHIWFDRKARKLHCDRCPVTEDLEEREAENHILCFSKAHKPCPAVSTEESRLAAGRRAFNEGFVNFFKPRP